LAENINQMGRAEHLESCAYEKLGFMDNSYYVIGRKYKSDGKS